MLQGLQTKTFLLPETVAEIEECLKERDTIPDAHLSPSAGPDIEMTGTASVTQTTPSQPKTTTAQRLDKKQIEQRIEEDRERHKRSREEIWAVPDVPGLSFDDAEFDKLWEETSELGEDDYEFFEEEYQQRKAAAVEHAEEYRKLQGMGHE